MMYFPVDSYCSLYGNDIENIIPNKLTSTT